MSSLYLGIDWSKNKHDIVAVNQQGAVIASLTVPHPTIQKALPNWINSGRIWT
jgi:hypothetical protein